MRILALGFAFVLVCGDEPAPKRETPSPVATQETWNLTLPEAIRQGLANPVPADRIIIGAVEIPIDSFEGMPKVPRPRSEDPKADELWNLALPDAIRLGLEHAEFVKIKPTDASFAVAIEPSEGEGSLYEFQAQAMALVRSIEVAYATLWRENATYQAREAALHQAEELLKQARAEQNQARLSLGSILEIEPKIEDFQLELVTATSDTITAERQLRNILGLAPADGRRIIPITRPIEAKVVPDWATSLAVMNQVQPDIVQQKVLARVCELQLLMALNRLLPMLGLDAVGQLQSLGSRLGRDWAELAKVIEWNKARNMRPLLDLSAMAAPDFCYQTVIFSPMPMNCFGRGPLASVRQAQYQLLHQNATVEAITRQATDSLARAFHAIEVNHDQFLADRRASVQAHLERESEGQNGRLDVIAQEANAKAREARSLAAYHASLVEFEEARGTLLDFDGIGWPGAPENASIAEALELIPSDLSDGSHGVRLIQERPVRGVMRSVVGTVIPVFYDPFLISKFSYITEATVHRRRSYPQAEKSDL